MVPNITKGDETLSNEEVHFEKLIAPQASPRKYKIVYRNIIVYLYYFLAAIYGIYLMFTEAKWQTILFGFITLYLTSLGVSAGSHRLWSHKSYKATKPLQLILMLFNSVANQHSVIHWVRDHRLHHKYSDTDADPHNATRGFFYSQIGWLLVRKHPEVLRRGKLIDISDVYGNPYLKFQHENSWWFIPFMCFVVPTVIPIYFWEETFSNSWHINMLRYVLCLNLAFFVNSIAHMWGNKPYDKTIAPSDHHFISALNLGESYHNFHHVFPWDYKSDELSSMRMNSTAMFIDICAYFGLAYDRKTVPIDMVIARAKRSGDGSKY